VVTLAGGYRAGFGAAQDLGGRPAEERRCVLRSVERQELTGGQDDGGFAVRKPQAGRDTAQVGGAGDGEAAR
jgi:hypothetical protein